MQLSQIKIFFDESQSPVGYVTWAYVSDELLVQLQKRDVPALHYSEWNEGGNLWIVDFVAPGGHAFSIARWISRNMFAGFREATGAQGDGETQQRRVYRLRRDLVRAVAHAS